jgi:HSP20 family molecular chaperone IbpA
MSSGAIKESEKLNIRQLEHVKNKLRREVRSLEDQHNLAKEELKRVHQDEINDVKIGSLKQINSETERKDKILSTIKDNLQATKDLTDKQLKNIKVESKNQIQLVKDKTSDDYEKVIQDHNTDLHFLDEKYKDQSRIIHQDGKKNIAEINDNLNEQYSDRKAQLLSRINLQENEFKTRINHQNKEHENTKVVLDDKNKKEIIQTHKTQHHQIAKLKKSHDDDMTKRDLEYRKGIKEQEVFFNNKYQKNQKIYKTEADNLDNRYKSLVNNMKNDIAKELKKTQERQEDTFYQFTELRPTWKNTEQGVEVQVNIPEYSKQDIQISINHKEVLLHFNRRYSDSNKGMDGIVNRLNKVESYTSKIDTGMFLDPKTVKSSFENGVMTYQIKKA